MRSWRVRGRDDSTASRLARAKAASSPRCFSMGVYGRFGSCWAPREDWARRSRTCMTSSGFVKGLRALGPVPSAETKHVEDLREKI